MRFIILFLLLSPLFSQDGTYDKIIKDKDYLLNVLKSGSEYGYNKSQKTLSKVYRKIGFIPRVR